MSVVHTYGHDGSHSVSLTVTDNGGASAAVTKHVAVTDLAPMAAFTVACSGLSCTFDGGGSADSDGTIASYPWSFGDGATGSGKTTSHDFPKAGTYTVTLTVLDNDGASASASQRINPISLSARGYKRGSQQKVDLTWSAPQGASLDVYRNGSKITTVSTAAYTDSVGKVPGTYTYKVCAPTTATCSNEVTVGF